MSRTNRYGVVVVLLRWVWLAALRAANKTLLASLPVLAVLLVLSTVTRLARTAVRGVVSDA